MSVDEGGPLHALVFATGKFVIFHDALFERRGIENAENFCPIFNSLVEVFNEHTDVSKRTTWHIHISFDCAARAQGSARVITIWWPFRRLRYPERRHEARHRKTRAPRRFRSLCQLGRASWRESVCQ